MSVILYTSPDDPRKVGKSLTPVATFPTVSFKGDVSVLQPTVILSYNMGVIQANYMYISDFGRYYFIRDKVVTSGGRIEVRGRVDVLTTYSIQIVQLTALRVRAELDKPTYITDNYLPLLPNKTARVIEFVGGDFNIETADNTSYNFVLNIAGGGANNAS